jgi:hypothetical protein
MGATQTTTATRREEKRMSDREELARILAIMVYPGNSSEGWALENADEIAGVILSSGWLAKRDAEVAAAALTGAADAWDHEPWEVTIPALRALAGVYSGDPQAAETLRRYGFAFPPRAVAGNENARDRP